MMVLGLQLAYVWPSVCFEWPLFGTRWAPREQTDRGSVRQTAGSPVHASAHGEGASPRHVRVTTAAIRHLGAEDGPSGKLAHTLVNPCNQHTFR